MKEKREGRSEELRESPKERGRNGGKEGRWRQKVTNGGQEK